MKNKIKNLIIISCISIFEPCFAQPIIHWSKCLGGSDGEGAYSIINTNDNGYLIIGGSTSFDGDVIGIHGYIDTVTGNTFTLGDAWVIKTDSLGIIQWQKCLGGSGIEDGIAGIETQGGYVIACIGSSSDGDESYNYGINDYWVVKLDFSGNIIWEYSYGGDQEEQVLGLAATTDGGFIISGSEHSLDTFNISGHHGGAGGDDIWIVKLDSLGLLQWQKCLGGTHMELFGQTALDSLGFIYVTAMTGSSDGDVNCNVNGHNAWLVKMDTNGNIIWDKCFGGTGGQQINSLRINGNRIIISGWSISSDGDLSHNYGYHDLWILFTDTAGNKIFSQSFGGSQTDESYDAILMDEDRIIAGGWSNSNDHDIASNLFPGEFNCWLVCVDTTGSLLWEEMFGGSQREICRSLVMDNNNSIIFTGWTNTPNDGDVVGHHIGNNNNDVWLVSLDILTVIKSTINKKQIQVYPQPFTDYFNIKLPISSTTNNNFTSISLFDLEGRKINSQFAIEENEIRVTPADNIIPGIYIFEMITKDAVYDFKVLKML